MSTKLCVDTESLSSGATHVSERSLVVILCLMHADAISSCHLQVRTQAELLKAVTGGRGKHITFGDDGAVRDERERLVGWELPRGGE